ncbi:MAG: hypothetical protein IPN16_16630 [Gemmatimonadetes bacterium]|nr:hypothetical protein [Gemmatimonadota bacterium]
MLRRHERELEVALLYRQRHPGSLLPTQDLVRAQCASGKWDDVRRLVSASFAMTSWESVASPATVALAAAGECAAHGNEALSRDIAKGLVRWLESRPSSEDGDLQLLQARVIAGDLTRAGPVAKALAVRFPESVGHLRAAGIVAALSGDREEAERMLVALGRLRDPYLRGEHTYAQAAIAARRGDRARAVTYLREAIRRGWNLAYLTDADLDLLSLRGLTAFDELVAPAG